MLMLSFCNRACLRVPNPSVALFPSCLEGNRATIFALIVVAILFPWLLGRTHIRSLQSQTAARRDRGSHFEGVLDLRGMKSVQSLREKRKKRFNNSEKDDFSNILFLSLPLSTSLSLLWTQT